MCDRHDRELDNYCTEHEQRICSDCATEEHSQTPCESVPVAKATRTIGAKTDTVVEELKYMKTVSQSILDGNRQEYSLRTIAEAEAKFDKYVEDMKLKFTAAKKSVRPFAELSREELWKLKAVTTKRLPNAVPRRDADDDGTQIDDMTSRLKEIRKQAKNARDVLQSLPNYVEITIDEAFLDSIKFDGVPVHIVRNGDVDEDATDDVNDAMSTATSEQDMLYLIEKRQFSLEHCTDLVLMDDYLIAAVGDSIHKRDLKHMAFRQGLSVPGAAKLCVIGETTEVAVLQLTGFISIIQTAPDLAVLYRLTCVKNYTDMSYLESVLGAGNTPKQSPVFAVCYNVEDYILIDYVDLIQAKPTKYPGKPPKYHVDLKNIADSSLGKNKARFRGIAKLCTLQGKYVLVGTAKGVSCLTKGGNLLWTIDMYRPIAHLLTHKRLIYVCVQHESRVLTIAKQGRVVQDNVLPVVEFVPERLNAYKDTMLVKIRGQGKWIFYKMMTET